MLWMWLICIVFFIIWTLDCRDKVSTSCIVYKICWMVFGDIIITIAKICYCLWFWVFAKQNHFGWFGILLKMAEIIDVTFSHALLFLKVLWWARSGTDVLLVITDAFQSEFISLIRYILIKKIFYNKK